MINKKMAYLISGLATICLISGIAIYRGVHAENIKVVDYKEPEEINENGYQITKYENVDAYDWIDEDNVLVLKDNGYYHNYDADIPMSYISIYNLNTKNYRDFSDVIMSSNSFYGISPSGRYVLYGEPRYIPEIESEEWEKASQSQELFHEKLDILDLTTGDVIEEFDKVVNNCSADYRWISDDKIFVNYGGEWDILNKEGKVFKKGYFNFDNCNNSYVNITGIDDINDLGDDCDGKFYYTKDFMGSSGSLGINIYSMDINSLKEEFVCKCEDSNESDKKGKNIAVDSFYNNGEANEDGVYEHRTFGFSVLDSEGNVIQKVELPEGRFTNLVKMSPHGTKGVFIDNIHKFPKEYDTIDVLNDSIKLLNISSGDIKEISKIGDLIDQNNDEQFYNNSEGDVKGMPLKEKIPGPQFGTISWDKNGKSFFFTYKYTSQKDGRNYTDTYVVTFDDEN